MKSLVSLTLLSFATLSLSCAPSLEVVSPTTSLQMGPESIVRLMANISFDEEHGFRSLSLQSSFFEENEDNPFEFLSIFPGVQVYAFNADQELIDVSSQNSLTDGALLPEMHACSAGTCEGIVELGFLNLGFGTSDLNLFLRAEFEKDLAPEDPLEPAPSAGQQASEEEVQEEEQRELLEQIIEAGDPPRSADERKGPELSITECDARCSPVFLQRLNDRLIESREENEGEIPDFDFPDDTEPAI